MPEPLEVTRKEAKKEAGRDEELALLYLEEVSTTPEVDAP
jgi:hypothetical protein